MPDKPMSRWRFCVYPQTLWIRLWKDGGQAALDARRIGPAHGLVKKSSYMFFFLNQTDVSNAELARHGLERAATPPSGRPAVVQNRAAVAPSRRFEKRPRGADPLPETRHPGFAHARGMMGEIVVPSRPVPQPVVGLDNESSRRRGRFAADEDFGAGEAGQRQHFVHMALQPGQVRLAQGGLHFKFDHVDDHAPVRLSRATNTKPNPSKIV